MKDTPEQSAELKRKFKAQFDKAGINAELPTELETERKLFPLEWAEACHEWENKL